MSAATVWAVMIDGRIAGYERSRALAEALARAVHAGHPGQRVAVMPVEIPAALAQEPAR